MNMDTPQTQFADTDSSTDNVDIDPVRVSTIVETEPDASDPHPDLQEDTPTSNQDQLTDEDELTDAECAEYDRLVADVLDAKGRCHEADLELGRRLLALVAFRSLTPRHERGCTWQQVAEGDLSMDVSRTYQLMDAARVDGALRDAGVEPLEVTSHGVALGPLREEPEQIVAAVQRAREQARDEGSPLAARHLTDEIGRAHV